MLAPMPKPSRRLLAQHSLAALTARPFPHLCQHFGPQQQQHLQQRAVAPPLRGLGISVDRAQEVGVQPLKPARDGAAHRVR
jgi:hypothetical protein